MAHLGGPVWLINDEDAQLYARSISNVLRHMDVAVAQKTIDFVNLAGMVAYIEGSRLVAMRAASKAPPPQSSAAAFSAPVFQFTPPPAPEESQVH